MRMKYFMGFYTCELGDTSTSQQQNFHDIRMDGREAFHLPRFCGVSPLGLVLDVS